VIHEFDVDEWLKTHKSNHYFLYQGSARSVLSSFFGEVIEKEKIVDPAVLMQPEKNYVNVFSTCRIHGIKLEKNPQKIVKFVAMLGTDVSAPRQLLPHLDDLFGGGFC